VESAKMEITKGAGPPAKQVSKEFFELLFWTELSWSCNTLIPTDFLCFMSGTGREALEKSEKFPAGILLPQNHRNYPEPAVSGPDCSTWIAKIIQRIITAIVMLDRQ
jgi:hypothetical protein